MIDGTAGAGKTALALRRGRQAAESFPDGQLHANLRGFSPGRPPLQPLEVLREFAHALGVPAEPEESRACIAACWLTAGC